jgi:hypothetical protein
MRLHMNLAINDDRATYSIHGGNWHHNCLRLLIQPSSNPVPGKDSNNTMDVIVCVLDGKPESGEAKRCRQPDNITFTNLTSIRMHLLRNNTAVSNNTCDSRLRPSWKFGRITNANSLEVNEVSFGIGKVIVGNTS